MDFIKDKNLLFQKIKQKISKWADSWENQPLSNEELRNFLQSLKRDARILQLEGVYQIASSLLKQLETMDKEQWQKEDLKRFLTNLKNLTEEYESYLEKEKQTDILRDEKIPIIQIIDDI